MEDYKAGIVSIIMVALIAGAFAIGVNDFYDDRVETISTTTVTNETVTLNNGTASNLANNYVVSVTSVVANLAGAYNETLTVTTDYTVGNLNDVGVGTVTLVNATYDGNSSYITYTYRDEWSTVDANATVEGLEGIANATSYLSTIGTLVGVAALVFVVLGAFYFAFKKM